MAFTLIQSASTLQRVTTAGVISNLTMPTGVTLDTSGPPRFAIFGRYVVVVNTPSRPVTVDGNGTVRVLSPLAPRTIMTLSGTGSGTLSGTYAGVKQTFRILDAVGNLIAESDYGPPSGTATITTNFLKPVGIDISNDDVTESQLYRPTTGGSVLYPWVAVSGNTATVVQDDLADAALSLVAAPTLGAAPQLTLIAEFRGRLWGVAADQIDNIRWTEAEMMYSWPDSNDLPIPRIGADYRGITALVARKEVLGIGRKNLLWQMVGTSNSDFRAVKVSENCGIESQESVIVYNDVAYFLWRDGVYTWDSNGVKSISDGKVRSWFATDTYFNRGRFRYAFARLDPNRLKYQLFLCSAGSSTIDRWVEYDLEEGTWWGPHKTDLFTPSCAFNMPDANDVLVATMGSSSGFLYQDQETRTDGTATAIAFNVDTKYHDGGTPDIEKYWGEVSMLGQVQSAGTLTVTPAIGYPGAALTQATISYDMTKGRQRLRRLGSGKMVQLNFQHATVGQNVELSGYECEFHELGRR